MYRSRPVPFGAFNIWRVRLFITFVCAYGDVCGSSRADNMCEYDIRETDRRDGKKKKKKRGKHTTCTSNKQRLIRYARGYDIVLWFHCFLALRPVSVWTTVTKTCGSHVSRAESVRSVRRIRFPPVGVYDVLQATFGDGIRLESSIWINRSKPYDSSWTKSTIVWSYIRRDDFLFFITRTQAAIPPFQRDRQPEPRPGDDLKKISGETL